MIADAFNRQSSIAEAPDRGSLRAVSAPIVTVARREGSVDRTALASLALLAGLLAAGCDSAEVPGYVGSGTLETESVVLSAEIAGTILALPRDEGACVSAGDTLAILDAEKPRLQLDEAHAAVAAAGAQAEQAAAALEGAREELANVTRRAERFRRLGERGSATEQSLEDLETQERVARHRLQAATAGLAAAQAQAARARAAVALLERMLADAVVLSPRDGTILTRFASEGELAAPGVPLIEVANLAEIWIKVYVSAAELAQIHPGAAARVYPDGMKGTVFNGTVTWISPEAEFTPKTVQTREARADLVFAVKVSLRNADGRLKPGLPADVAWEQPSDGR